MAEFNVHIGIISENIWETGERVREFILYLREPLYYQKDDDEDFKRRIDQIILVRYENCDRDWEIKDFLKLMAKMMHERRKIIIEAYKKEKNPGYPVDGYSIEVDRERKNMKNELCHDLLFWPESGWKITFSPKNSTWSRTVIISLIILVVASFIGWWIKSVKSSRSAKKTK
jgi:hypothetical protein